MVQQKYLPGPRGDRTMGMRPNAGNRLDDEPTQSLLDSIPDDADLDDLDQDDDPGKATAVAEPSEPGAGDQDTDGDIPEEYFGVRLADIPDPEARKATYDQLQAANRVANRRLQEIAELRKKAEDEATAQLVTPQAPTPEPDLDEMTDEELLQAAGIDPSLLQYEEMGKPLVQMARRQLALERQVEQTVQASEAAAWEQKFYGELGQLESDFGAIPYARADVEAYAIERNIYDPNALYWSIMGPIQREMATGALTKADAAQAATRDLKRQVRSPQRRGSATGTVQAKKPATLQEAYEQARQQVNIPAGHDPFAFEE